MANVPRVRVPKVEIQAIFNREYLHLVMSGHLREDIVDDGVPAPEYNQPPGTRSITAKYFAPTVPDIPVAVAHYFWLAQAPGLKWRIGGSGVPDPKAVYWNGVLLIPDDDQ